MRPVRNILDLLYAWRGRVALAEFSRMRIQVVRLCITGDSAECDWLMRPPDQWDHRLPPPVREEHRTGRALDDALQVRELIFRGFPEVHQAKLRMYRDIGGSEPELMLVGHVERETHGAWRPVASIVARARLFGFRFSLIGGGLERIAPS
ncbi:MAG TPA: hypothetical protein VG714_09375 [Acidobacteriaceae bacterium]|nr:hypothetical protein [Acidobacteriaceae bacterium]